MIIRVPLVLQSSVAVIYRLDVKATRQADPEGEATSGYDETLREPIAYTGTGGDREDSRREFAVIRVPCQVEIMTDEKLREMVTGNDPVSNMVFVFHRADLERLGLLNTNRDVILKTGDRIEGLERFGGAVGAKTKTFEAPGLFIHQMQSRSWGFGPDGYDLELALISDRRRGFKT